MEKKLNVGLFLDTFFPMVDGVVLVVDNYAKRLSRFCDVTVFCPEGREPFDDSKLPYNVVRCKTKLPLDFLDYDLPMPSWDKHFTTEVKNSDFDIIHIHSPFTIGKIGVKFAKKHEIPVVATMHSQFKQDFQKSVKIDGMVDIMLSSVMKVFNGCDECWAVNGSTAQVFLEYGATKMPLVYNNGTDLRPYENEEEIKKLKERYNIKDDEKVLLFTGRLVEAKNIFFIADVLKLLKDKGFKFKMVFIGTGPDEQKLKARIQGYELQDDVIFTGRIVDREEIAKHYKCADLFVFPSLYDASSLVQIEAASQSTPTVFLRGAVTSGTITENVNGYIAEPDELSFAEKVIRIFENKTEYERICANAFKDLYVLWDDVVAEVYKGYNRIIEEYNSKK